jgi:hypothetical protein
LSASGHSDAENDRISLRLNKSADFSDLIRGQDLKPPRSGLVQPAKVDKNEMAHWTG